MKPVKKKIEGGVKMRASKDRRAVIIGGKRWPLTENNLLAWRAYLKTGDKEQLMFKLSTVVFDFEMADPKPPKTLLEESEVGNE